MSLPVPHLQVLTVIRQQRLLLLDILFLQLQVLIPMLIILIIPLVIIVVLTLEMAPAIMDAICIQMFP